MLDEIRDNPGEILRGFLVCLAGAGTLLVWTIIAEAMTT